MKKNLLLIVTLSSLLFSCGDITPPDYVYTYTVIWQNYNGDILEIDRNLTEGSIPTYDGLTPTREDDNATYVFAGWEEEITPVTENTTYTAKFSLFVETYTITWKNYDGTILETDTEVSRGTLPTYDGKTPNKPSEGDKTYFFTGWSPSVVPATEDAVYTAKFYEYNTNSNEPGINPTLSSDGKTIEYGYYPQTRVKDTNIINQLNTLSAQANGWYFYEGDYYAKEVATIYNNEAYTFNDGASITQGSEYWFKCEPIKWSILNETDGSIMLLSTLLLDTSCYYKNYNERLINDKIVYSNNYKESDIRTWLNDDFYNKAFVLNNKNIKETIVDNSSTTTDTNTNSYTCENTNDKVYLLSYQDYLNPNYGFDSNSQSKSNTRTAKTTDYTRVKGAWCNTSYNGAYWTRSPSSEFTYTAWNVNGGGYLTNYAVEGSEFSIRPAITITL